MRWGKEKTDERRNDDGNEPHWLLSEGHDWIGYWYSVCQQTDWYNQI